MRGIVPAHKQDFAACEALAKATDHEVEAHIDALLVWLQDYNWPVSGLVHKRIVGLGDSLAGPLAKIMASQDNVWKYWIVHRLLPELPQSVWASLDCALQRINNDPTDDEIAEDLPHAVQELLGERYRDT